MRTGKHKPDNADRGAARIFIDNELYRDVVEPKSTLEQIRAEELHLIAYEVFS